jgi:hypothetical protein
MRADVLLSISGHGIVGFGQFRRETPVALLIQAYLQFGLVCGRQMKLMGVKLMGSGVFSH